MLPSSGWVYLPGTCPTLVCQESVWGNLQHAIMPALALGVGRAAILTRLLRASMLEIIRLEYVTTARAKGLAEKTIILKHALKNALIPTVTIMGLQVGFHWWCHCHRDALCSAWLRHLWHQCHHCP